MQILNGWAINFNINLQMKKTRTDKSQPQAITLSSKRGSLNQEQLFVPYKIDWKNSPLQTVENNSSRAFFQNMKAELSNIKNDFEKLIKKEGPIAEKMEDMRSGHKQKCQSAYKKDQKRPAFERYPENQKLQIVMNNKEENDHFFKILNLQKNLPCNTSSDYKNGYSKTINVKEYIAKESKPCPFEAIEIQKNQRVQSSRAEKAAESARSEEKQKELLNLKEVVSTLQSQLREAKEECNFTKAEAQRLFTDNNTSVGKIADLSNQLSYKIELVHQQQTKIQNLQQSLRKMEEQASQRANTDQEFNNERIFYNERINELMFHNQNLGVNNMQLANENQMLKENCTNLERFIEDQQKRSENMAADHKRKLEYLQRDIQEYQKREDMFSKEIEKLNFERLQVQQPPQNITKCFTQNQSSSQLPRDDYISELQDEIRHLKNQVNIEKEIHTALSKKYEDQIASLRIQEMSRQFQEKINKLIDENCKLKSKMNFLQSSIESINEKNQSYLLQISLYEEREKAQASKQLTSSQWQELTEQIEKLREQNKRLTEQIQFKALKVETEHETELPTSSCDSLIRMANLQLLENQKLKETIRELSTSLKSAEQRIQSLTLVHSKLNEVSSASNSAEINKRFQEIRNEIQKKTNQINGLKEIVFKVLIEKTNKLEDEQELQYYLKQVDQRKACFGL